MRRCPFPSRRLLQLSVHVSFAVFDDGKETSDGVFSRARKEAPRLVQKHLGCLSEENEELRSEGNGQAFSEVAIEEVAFHR